MVHGAVGFCKQGGVDYAEQYIYETQWNAKI